MTKVLTAQTVCDEHGSPLHTNLNFGGRFGHAAIYHSLFSGREAADHETALRLDRQRDWHVERGYIVTISSNPLDGRKAV